VLTLWEAPLNLSEASSIATCAVPLHLYPEPRGITICTLSERLDCCMVILTPLQHLHFRPG
jgi:hypothetical protein